MDGVQFDTEKQDQYELQALDKAMANAKAKAETLAKAAGKQLKDVITISQNSMNAVPIYIQRNTMMADKAADSAPRRAWKPEKSPYRGYHRHL